MENPILHGLTMPAFRYLLAGMNPHVLIVVTKPLEPNSIDWTNFCDGIAPSISERNKPEERLAENIWLIPLNTGLPFLGQLVSAAQLKLTCKILHFDDMPQWICLERTGSQPAA
jgi:hypothetical protein